MGSLVGQGIVGVALPALLALILNVVLLRIQAAGQSQKWLLIGLVISGSFVFSYSVGFGGVVFPPREATHWLPYTAFGAWLIGLILLVTKGFVRSAIRLLAALVVTWTILQLQILGRWPALISAGWLVAVTLILFATSRLLERLEGSRSRPVEVLFGMALATGFGGIALFFGGSAIVGQICATFGLILAGLTLATFFFSVAHLGPIIPLIYVFVFGSLLLNGCLFSELPWLTAGLLWIAPFGVFAGAPAPSVGNGGGARLLVRGVIVLVVVALAFVALFLIAPPGAEY
jgi:hypothetical protein